MNSARRNWLWPWLSALLAFDVRAEQRVDQTARIWFRRDCSRSSPQCQSGGGAAIVLLSFGSRFGSRLSRWPSRVGVTLTKT